MSPWGERSRAIDHNVSPGWTTYTDSTDVLECTGAGDAFVVEGDRVSAAAARTTLAASRTAPSRRRRYTASDGLGTFRTTRRFGRMCT